MLYRYWQWTPTEQSTKNVYTSTLQAGQYQPSQSPTGNGHLLAMDTYRAVPAKSISRSVPVCKRTKHPTEQAKQWIPVMIPLVPRTDCLLQRLLQSCNTKLKHANAVLQPCKCEVVAWDINVRISYWTVAWIRRHAHGQIRALHALWNGQTKILCNWAKQSFDCQPCDTACSPIRTNALMPHHETFFFRLLCFWHHVYKLIQTIVCQKKHTWNVACDHAILGLTLFFPACAGVLDWV